MKTVFLTLSVLVLSGCSLISNDQDEPLIPPSAQCDDERRYCIDFGSSMALRKWTDNWTSISGAITDHTISNGLHTEDQDYLRADVYSIASCSPSITGVSAMQSTSSYNTTWGKVDYFELYPGGDFPKGVWPICRPPVGGSAYALCSEKDGKTVFICISQVTDNPQLAEEIFTSFKWTD